ncbi:uncharacterized protein LOC124428164 [Vespa crabro]|uniref:uncharacterized protein LOC124428164 n=1 Tax=Vespa crabro TaxID=7445 RepID=UPI001F00FFF6|nr:uncharacterized protein LOC124428164 [Vespa crabro]
MDDSRLTKRILMYFWEKKFETVFRCLQISEAYIKFNTSFKIPFKMHYDEEIYADLLSKDNNCSDSQSDLDSGSDIIVRRFENKGRPIISKSESDEENSVANDWSEVDNLTFMLAWNGLNNDNNNASTKNKAWVDINVVEMKKFLGLVILMGIVKKPEQDDYWSTHPGLHSPIFGKTMPRNRFRQLWKY